MYLDIQLDDGRAAGPFDFSVQNPAQPLTADRRRALALAWEYRGKSEGIAIVLAKNKRLVGAAYGHEDWVRALDAAAADLRRTYRFYGWPLPERGVVALIRPFPEVRLETLARVGVDTIFSLMRLDPDPNLHEQPWVDQWLGFSPQENTARKRIFIMPHYATEKKLK